MKNCQEIGSIVGGGSSVQCSCTITMFLLTQVEHSIIIYASRPLCNKNVARDNLSQFRTNSFQCIIFAFSNLFFFFRKQTSFRFNDDTYNIYVSSFIHKFIYKFCLFLNAIKIFYHGNDIYKRYFYPILLKGFFYPQCNSLFPFIMSTTHACVTRIHKIGVQWERHAFEHRILASYESFRE